MNKQLLTLAIPVLSVFMGAASAAPLNIAFLSAESAAEKIGPHERGAWEAARTLGNATLLLLQESGAF